MNADADITRVRVRDKLMPLVRAENPAIEAALVRLADATREWLDVIDATAAPLGRFPIDCPTLAGHPPAIRKRALALALDREGLGYEAAHLDDLDALVTAPARGEVGIDLSGARAVRSYDRLELDQSPPEPAGVVPRFRAPAGYMLRPWQPGDRMCPLRLRGHSKKLSDLYIDAKVPREARRTAQVMVRIADNVVVWAEHIGIAFGEALDLAPVPG
jgi:tRNA(Ile)-lysidine synthetase-like protein